LSLAGTVLIDFETEPLGKASGQGDHGLMPYLKVLFQNQSLQFLLRTRRPWVDALPKGSVSKSINTVPAKDKETMG
jgi:hypothetical protein